MNYNEPIEWLETNLAQYNICHGGDPILRWMVGNVVLYKNRTGLVMFDKRDAKERIDGMVSFAMSVGGYQDWKRNEKPPIDAGNLITFI